MILFTWTELMFITISTRGGFLMNNSRSKHRLMAEMSLFKLMYHGNGKGDDETLLFVFIDIVCCHQI